MAASKFRMAIVQLAVSADKAVNLSRAASFISEAAGKGAHVVALPECFNSPYGIEHFKQYSEEIPGGESASALSKAAKENKVYVVGGSIPEKDESKIYNTCTVWGPDGNLVAKFRKMHLFDIDIPGKITFQESKTLSPGSEFVTFDTPFCKVGLGICYDLRFPEIAQFYAQNGCKLLVYPGAFNMTTGPLHWKALQVGRALDNQLYVASVSPARVEGSGYVAYGHSMVIDPFGKVLTEGGGQEEMMIVDLDMDYVDQVRKQIPLMHQKRHDMYELKGKN